MISTCTVARPSRTKSGFALRLFAVIKVWWKSVGHLTAKVLKRHLDSKTDTILLQSQKLLSTVKSGSRDFFSFQLKNKNFTPPKEQGLAIVGGQKPRTASVEYYGHSGQWVSMPSLPIPTSSSQIVWNPDTNELYTFGGYQSVRGKGASSNDVYKIKVAKNILTKTKKSL